MAFKTKIAIYIISLFMLVGFILPVSPVRAAGDQGLVLKDFSLSVWPEYDKPKGWKKDKPAVLVRYEGKFLVTGSQPVSDKLSFNIPENIQVNMVCETENGMACQPYTIETLNGKQVLSWKPSRTINPGEEFPFMVEFYYNPIQAGQNGQKTIDYSFMPSYPIQNMAFDVKQPLKATNFVLDPQPLKNGQDGSGFNTFVYEYTNLKENDEIKAKISYVKADNEPSVNFPEANQPAAGSEQGTLVTSSWTRPTVLVPVLVFLAFLTFLVYFGLAGKVGQQAQRTKVKTAVKSGKNSTNQNSGARPSLALEKKKARQKLLNGEISEETYKQLIKEIETEHLG